MADALLYGHLAYVLRVTLPRPHLKPLVDRHNVLSRFYARMAAAYPL